MDKYKRALHDATSVYKHPKEVVTDETLTREQKIQILRQWEYDIRDMQVAEEENMIGSGFTGATLTSVLKALSELGVKADPDNLIPTKQGGDPTKVE